MSSTSISTAVLPGALSLGGPAGEGRAAAARARGADAASSPDAGPSLLLPWLAQALGGAASGSGWLVSPVATRPSAIAGYAQAATSRGASGTSTKASGEWSFLSDASLTIEDKLARFMQAVQKKIDDELTQKMEDYKAKYGEGGTETKKDSGGFLGRLLGAIFPPLSLVGDLFGGLEGFLGDALKSLGGPLLAALATAVGAPMLAPAALKLGDALGKLLGGSSKSTKTTLKGGGTTTPEDIEAQRKAKTSASTSTTKSTSSKGTGSSSKSKGKDEAGSPDERLAMLEIQRLVDKQNELFSLVSNVLKGMHDTSMTTIQNLR